MTTTNGDRGRIVEYVEGIVVTANERGLHLQGEEAWRNFSKFGTSPSTAPRSGQRVSLGLDASGFIRTSVVLDAGPSSTSNSLSRDATITRLSVLKSAANFVGLWGQARPEIKSDHVLLLADKWLAWVEQEGGDESD